LAKFLDVTYLCAPPWCFDLKDDTFGADFLLYDKTSGRMGADRAQDALGRGEYVHVAERGSVVLLKRKP
jgi:hypothetical protein